MLLLHVRTFSLKREAFELMEQHAKVVSETFLYNLYIFHRMNVTVYNLIFLIARILQLFLKTSLTWTRMITITPIFLPSNMQIVIIIVSSQLWTQWPSKAGLSTKVRGPPSSLSEDGREVEGRLHVVTSMSLPPCESDWVPSTTAEEKLKWWIRKLWWEKSEGRDDGGYDSGLNELEHKGQ